MARCLPSPQTADGSMGADFRCPHMVAVSSAESEPLLTLMPPTEDVGVVLWDSDMFHDYEALTHLQGWETQVCAVGEAFAICRRCVCPLPEQTAAQSCPNCGTIFQTRVLSHAAKQLKAVVVCCATQEELLRATRTLRGVRSSFD